MNDHYYSASPLSEHQYQTALWTYRGHDLKFKTDAGVFSKGEVDYGTQVLLKSLPESLTGRVLDLGCGWGAVGVSVAKIFPDAQVVMSDVNRRALDLARENARVNGVSAQILESDGLDNVDGDFDFILTNPPIRAGKQVIYRMFADSAQRLGETGQLFLVIRKQQGAESALRYLKTVFHQVDTVEKSSGFWVIRCQGGNQDGV